MVGDIGKLVFGLEARVFKPGDYRAPLRIYPLGELADVFHFVRPVFAASLRVARALFHVNSVACHRGVAPFGVGDKYAHFHSELFHRLCNGVLNFHGAAGHSVVFQRPKPPVVDVAYFVFGRHPLAGGVKMVQIWRKFAFECGVLAALLLGGRHCGRDGGSA